MKSLPCRGRCCVQLEWVEVWILRDVMSCTGYLGTIRDAVSECFAMIGDACELALDACEAEALILEVALLFVDARERAVWGIREMSGLERKSIS